MRRDAAAEMSFRDMGLAGTSQIHSTSKATRLLSRKAVVSQACRLLLVAGSAHADTARAVLVLPPTPSTVTAMVSPSLRESGGPGANPDVRIRRGFSAWSTTPVAGLSRLIAVINGKGGVFKTSLVAANLGGLLADGGPRVLLVDLDPQGNLAEDLGYANQGDGGRSLAASLCFGGEPNRLTGVRPNLDLIAGGPHLDDAAAFLGAKAQKDRTLRSWPWPNCLGSTIWSCWTARPEMSPSRLPR